MDFKQKKEKSQKWDKISRAAFFIPENLPKKYIHTGLPAGSKSISIYNDSALEELSKSRLIQRGSVAKSVNLTI